VHHDRKESSLSQHIERPAIAIRFYLLAIFPTQRLEVRPKDEVAQAQCRYFGMAIPYARNNTQFTQERQASPERRLIIIGAKLLLEVILLGTDSIRVLVVDDYEPWHDFISTMLHNQPELEIIGHVSDGLEAVQHAERLQPDLILMDIGLPALNEIEAASRIREVSPTSKVLFVSQNRSPEIVQEALSKGACGYVVKSHAGRESSQPPQILPDNTGIPVPQKFQP